jgi:hypothetical protein
VSLDEEERREGEEEISDHQLAQVDTVAALLRMDILPRLRYLLTVRSRILPVLRNWLVSDLDPVPT